jgi:hypothetical protein
MAPGDTTVDTVGEFAAVPTTGGKSGLCGPESPLSSQIPDGSGGNIERTPNSPTVSLLGLGPVPGKISFDVGLYTLLGIFLYFLSRIVRDRTLSYPAFVKD